MLKVLVILILDTMLWQEDPAPRPRSTFDRWMAAAEELARAEQRMSAAERKVADMHRLLEQAWEQAQMQLREEQRATAGWAAMAKGQRAAYLKADAMVKETLDWLESVQAQLREEKKKHAACQAALAAEAARKGALAGELAAEREAHSGTQAALESEHAVRAGAQAAAAQAQQALQALQARVALLEGSAAEGEQERELLAAEVAIEHTMRSEAEQRFAALDHKPYLGYRGATTTREMAQSVVVRWPATCSFCSLASGVR